MEKLKYCLALTLALLVGCSPAERAQHAEFETVSLPPSLTALENGWNLIWHPALGLQGIYRTGMDEREYFLVDLESFNVNQLVFETEHPCLVKWYGGFSLLPDGRLGMGLTCFTGANNQSHLLLAYDFVSKETNALIEGSLPAMLPLRSFAWAPDLSAGVHAVDNGLAGSLFWIYPDGYSPMEITLAQGNRAWDMAELFDDAADVRGIASDPAWSPTTDQLVFFAGIFHETTSGVSKIGAQLSLYMMSLGEKTPVELKSGFVVPGGTTWSPTGNWIAFSSQLERFSQDPQATKLWLYSIDSGRLIEIAEGKNISLAWDPTGERLAAVFCSTISCDETEIRIYDVADIVDSE